MPIFNKLYLQQILYLFLAFLCIIGGILYQHEPFITCSFYTTHGEDILFTTHVDEHIQSFGDVFTKRSYWPGLYRPLTTNLYYYLLNKIWGNQFGCYHILNLSFFILNGLLVFLLIHHFTNLYGALLGTVLFVTRCSHIDVITHNCEFQVIFCVFWLLLCFLLYLRFIRSKQLLWMTASVLSFGLAMLSRETAIILPLLLLFYHLIFVRERKAILWTWPFWGIGGIWVIAYLFIFQPIVGQATWAKYDYSLNNIMPHYLMYVISYFNIWAKDMQTASGLPPHITSFLSQPANSLAAILIHLSIASLIGLVYLRRLNLSAYAKGILFGIIWHAIAVSPFCLFAGRYYLRYGYLAHPGFSLSIACIAIWVIKIGTGYVKKHRKHHSRKQTVACSIS